MAKKVSLPNQWEARHYERDLFGYMLNGGLEKKRAVAVWHRRAGKDSTSINLAAVASQMRVGTIWHMLPTLKQGRRVIWDAIDREGRKVINQAFPPEMVVGKNNSEMKLELHNGSIYQVVGSDNYDSLVGTNPVGVIFSEYSIADPSAWDYIRPILAENDGWAVFIYTPRGKNHGFNLLGMARKNPRWFVSVKTVDDTYRATVLPTDPAELAKLPHVISKQAVDDERAAGMGEEKIAQEFYCSFEAGLEGAYYTRELNAMWSEKRIGDYPWDPSKPVFTFWDIGRDTTSIGFYQVGEDLGPIIIDYEAERNMGLPDFVRIVESKPYNYGNHNGPHDLGNIDWSVNKTRLEIAEGLGFKFNIVPKLSVVDGVDATRIFLRRLRVNEKLCGKWIDGITSYRRDFDERNNVFKDQPVHDWASHPADMTRYSAVGWDLFVSVEVEVGSKQFKVKRAIGG